LFQQGQEIALAKPGGFSDDHPFVIGKKNKVIEEGDSNAASQVSLPDDSGAAGLVPTAQETSAGLIDTSSLPSVELARSL